MIEFSGIITIFGKPNVGKSSLLNALSKQQLSAVNAKAQTTIKALKAHVYFDNYQLIFIDTPGIQSKKSPFSHRSANRIASRELHDSHINMMVIDANQWRHEDNAIIKNMPPTQKKQILVLNKCDLIDDNQQQLLIEQATQLKQFDFIVPISAKKNINLETLKSLLKTFCPKQAWLQLTELGTQEQSEKDIEDCMRSAMLKLMSRELPYITKIHVKSIQTINEREHVDVEIITDRDSRKKMLIGKNGDMIKNIGKHSRLSLESRWKKPVYLKTHVLVQNA
ncbi:GTPase Era [Gammaproteobacteria bacterium]|nr:GTPase Era [Gammaproteobacteria bacterium]